MKRITTSLQLCPSLTPTVSFPLSSARKNNQPPAVLPAVWTSSHMCKEWFILQYVEAFHYLTLYTIQNPYASSPFSLIPRPIPTPLKRVKVRVKWGGAWGPGYTLSLHSRHDSPKPLLDCGKGIVSITLRTWVEIAISKHYRNICQHQNFPPQIPWLDSQLYDHVYFPPQDSPGLIRFCDCIILFSTFHSSVTVHHDWRLYSQVLVSCIMLELLNPTYKTPMTKNVSPPRVLLTA